MDRQQAEARLEEILNDYLVRRTNCRTIQGAKDIIPYLAKQILKSFVSEDVRNHHQGICFRVNETDKGMITQQVADKIKELANYHIQAVLGKYGDYELDTESFEHAIKSLVSEDKKYWMTEYHYNRLINRGTDKEITKRMIEEYRSLYAENPDTKTPWLDGFDNWLEKED